MKLNTRSRYAVMAMVDLALNEQETKVTSLNDISERQELPLPYLEQIFAKLKKANLVTSVRGASGGYTLGRPTQAIRISDIIYAVEPPSKTTRCGDHEKKGCHSSGSRCATHDLWEALGLTIHSFFSKITLKDVLNNTLSTSSPANENHVNQGDVLSHHGTRHVL